MGRFKDKVAIVTGAGSGIGLVTALALAHEGARVVLVSRSVSKLEEAARRIAADQGQETLTLSLDVRRPDDMEAMADRTREHFGQIDLLVAAAGTIGSVSHEMKLPPALAHLPLEEWDLIIDTNLKGLIHGNRAVLRHMMKQNSGDIINVGSYPASLRGSAHAAAYTASKHAVRGLSQAIAEEVRPFGIRVQAILPGPTDTPMLYGTNAVARHGVLTAETVAAEILHLASLPRDTVLGESVLYAVKPAGTVTD